MQNQLYYFILGSNPALSLAELTAIFGTEDIMIINEQVALLETSLILEPEKLIRKLGGIIKIGLIVEEIEKPAPLAILEAAKKLLKPKEGKFKFGVSVYGKGKSINSKFLGMELKKFLQEQGTSVRWVTSNEPTLSSVVVEQNGLLKNGLELVLLFHEGQVALGQTLVVQPFKELSKRDYGRPSRDDLSGMLPPKLAQIMINLTGGRPEQTLLDPFCGSGTIITEAALMGFKNLIGTDSSEKAIADSKTNFSWLVKNYQLLDIKNQFKVQDASKITQYLRPETIDVMAMEPYLGPQRGKHETKKIVFDLETLYTKCLAEFYQVLKPTGRIVMIWPIFITPIGRIMLSKRIAGQFKIVPPLKINENQKIPGLSDRNTLIYGRDGQKVWREIVILEK